MNDKTLQRLKDEDFVIKLMKSSDVKEVKKVFQDENLVITDEEVREIIDTILEGVNKIKNMSDDELANVAGGVEKKKVVGGVIAGAGGVMVLVGLVWGAVWLGDFLYRKFGKNKEENQRLD